MKQKNQLYLHFSYTFSYQLYQLSVVLRYRNVRFIYHPRIVYVFTWCTVLVISRALTRHCP